MRSHIVEYDKIAPISAKQRKKLEEQEKQKTLQRNSEVLKVVLTLFCYVLHKRYHWTTKTLQSIIDETYTLIYEARETSNGKDWTVGVDFWAKRMGLKL